MSAFLASLLALLSGAALGQDPHRSAGPAASTPPAHRDPNLYYVDPVRGRDEGNGRSPAQPWRTLTYALPRAQGGPGMLFLAPGEYSEASGERFPLRPLGYQNILGRFPRGARIRGPRDADVPVFEVTGALQSINGIEIVTDGVAFVLAGGSGFDQGWLELNIAAEIRAQRALDVHFGPYSYPPIVVSFEGDVRTKEAAVRVDGSFSGGPFHLVLQNSALSVGRESAIVDFTAGGQGSVMLTCRNSALDGGGAGLRFLPSAPLALTVDVESSVLHALGNADVRHGGPLFVEGAGALAVSIRRSIFWRNHGDVDLPGYDGSTYTLEENLVQQRALVGVGGSITGDPRFADAQGGDFHLRPDSPARGVGLSPAMPFDREGDPRGLAPDDGRVDLGLDEFYPRYHWFHPRPRLGQPTVLRITGQPGDLALAFASASLGGLPSSVGIGWQLGDLLSPRPFAVATIGADGTAEVPLVLPRDLGDARLRTHAILTQVRYVTPLGGTEVSANAAVVFLRE